MVNRRRSDIDQALNDDVAQVAAGHRAAGMSAGLVSVVPCLEPVSLTATEGPDVFMVTRERYAGEELTFTRDSSGTVAGFRAKKLVEA